MEGDIEESLPESARKNANCLSVLTFWYTLSVFRKGFTKELTEDDLTKALPEHKSSYLGNMLSKNWAKEVAFCEKYHLSPSLVKVLFKTFIKDILLYAAILFAMEMLVRMSLPIFIGLVIRYFNPANRNNTLESTSTTYFRRFIDFKSPISTNPIKKPEAFFFGFGIFLSSAIIVFVYHPFLMAVLHVGMKMRVACCSLIYRKALRMTYSAVGDNRLGNPVNLMSNDVTRFDLAPIYLHYIWIAPLQALFILYNIYKEIGRSAMVGFSPVLLIMILQIVLGILSAHYRLKVALRTDARVTEMGEIIQGLGVIKMYTWEYAFANHIKLLRRNEMKMIKMTSYIRGMIMSFIMFTARLAVFLTVVTMLQMDDMEPDAEMVFVITAYYQIIRQTMSVFFPQGFAMVGECYVSIKRIERYMLIEEAVVGNKALIDEDLLSRERRKHLVEIEVGYNHSLLDLEERPSIEINNVIAMFKNSIIVSNIVLAVQPMGGKPIIIIGPVGAGKSGLFNLILGELSVLKGTVYVKGKISYACQEPWLFSGSVRQNILFGQPYDTGRYRQVVKACALTTDFAILPYADRTLVGERGSTLSGGQRARINLARAVYQDADIYLLDDPLSAVDISVGQHLFHQCIMGYLKDKLVVLITHQLQYLKFAGHIFIFQDGMIQDQGTYESLELQKLDFDKVAPAVELSDVDVRRLRSTIHQPTTEHLLKSISLASALQLSVINKEGLVKLPMVEKEMRSYGAVDFQIYKSYFLATGHVLFVILMIVFFLSAQIAASLADWFLCKWINLEELQFNVPGWYGDLDRKSCILIYTIFIVSTVVIAISRSVYYFTMTIRSSQRLHDQMFRCIIHATMAFFAQNSSGRILNRFSKDLGAVDELLPNAFIDTVQVGLNFLGAVLVVTYVEPFLLIPTIVVAFAFYWLRWYYLRTSRSVKRLEGITKSPVFAHLNASLQGLTTIRNHGNEKLLVDEFDKLQDIHSSAWFMFLSTSRGYSMWADFICTIYITICTFAFIIFDDRYFGSDVGLVITLCMGLSGLVQWGMRQSAELENQMTAVERVLEFTRIEQEADLESAAEKKPPPDWPTEGQVEFRNLSMRYLKEEDFVLKNLNFKIEAREKIGIVGRTGAGKSSIINCFFRLIDFEGQVFIDGFDTKQFGLHDLRQKISIIPQEPVLFSGTLRYNLDPFKDYDDEAIYNSLLAVEIVFAVRNGIECLDMYLSEGGANFSVGQRQMVCLARAILRNNKILVLDEATANVDPDTDRFIQHTIRTKFAHCTVITIAHRLHTIMDSDKVLVLDAGQIVEFAHPHELLRNKFGMFSTMVDRTGKEMAATLRQIAKENYQSRND